MSGDLSLPVMLATGILPGLGARRAPGPAWHPSDFFPLSQPGIFLDGSDNSVMWQDAAGTTPVTALGQSVGLVLDKRLWQGKSYAQILAEQAELRGNGVTGLVGTATAATYNTSTGEGTAARVDAGNQSFVKVPVTPGRPHRIKMDNTGSVTVLVRDGGHLGTQLLILSTGNSGDAVITPSFSPLYIAASGGTASFTLESLREVPSIVAYQTTSASRPVWQENDLGARGLWFDAVNDFLVTPSIDFSASDKMLVSAGVRKLSDAQRGMLIELGDGLLSEGLFRIQAPSSNGLNNYMWNSGGTITRNAIATGFAAPISNAITGLGDISGDICRIRVNGALAADNTDDQGTGNFSNSPLYIGRRGGSSLPFSGFLHQLVIRGGAWPDASELAQLEAYLASKSGVSL